MRQKKLTAIFAVLCIIVGIMVLFNLLRREAARGSDLDKEIQRLQSEIDKLESRNSALIGLTKELSDLDFLENEARVKMGLKMPGEEVVVINRATSSIINNQENQETKNPSLWENPKRWLRYFFNKR